MNAVPSQPTHLGRLNIYQKKKLGSIKVSNTQHILGEVESGYLNLAKIKARYSELEYVEYFHWLDIIALIDPRSQTTPLHIYLVEESGVLIQLHLPLRALVDQQEVKH